MVDRDVAANSKPFSMAFAVIPFVPFMIFVDGAPAERFPILSGLAVGASLCWLAFFMWRYLLYARAELEGDGYTAGSLRFWRLLIVTLLLVIGATLALMWLGN